jgi:hypothetical protein
MAARKRDRLLTALIGKLPPEKTPWSRDDRISWLWMMALAFDVVYGPCCGIRIEPEHIGETLSADGAVVMLRHGNGTNVPVERNFYIDRDGFAMGNGQPIGIEDLPPNITLWDERTGIERGDIASILWRDIGTTRRSLPTGITLRPASDVA